MKAIKIIFQISIIFLFALKVQAQTGWNEDDEEPLEITPKNPVPSSGEKGQKSITSTDLTQGIPRLRIINQGSVESCVSWSICYYAYTIQRARLDRETDPQRMQAIALSAMFPFKRLRPNECNRGLSISKTAKFLLDFGNLPYQRYPTNQCNIPISPTMITEAGRNKPITNYQLIFSNEVDKDPTARYKKVLDEIIFSKRPVVVGMKIWEDNLRAVNSGDDYYYRPTNKGKTPSKHAVTVVGFDINRRAFKILNSWGSEFGDNGIFWMRLEDFGNEAVIGYSLVLPDRKTFGTKGDEMALGGKFDFLYQDNVSDKFENAQPYHVSNGLYQLNKRNWKVGQFFQLATNNDYSGQSLCVFSIDAQNEVTIHWPLNEAKDNNQTQTDNDDFGLGNSDQMPNRNYRMVIPNEDSALMIEKPGTDYLCVLYSDNSLIQDLPKIIRNIKNSSNTDVPSRIRNALGNRLINPSQVDFQSSGMSFSLNGATSGDTVPMILKIESVN
jgi:hypothetical protein